MHKLVFSFVTALFFIGLTGCDSNDKKNSGSSGSSTSSSTSSSGSSSSSSSGAVLLGNVQVHFPPQIASTDKTRIRVRGRVVDSTGLAQLTINGTPVTSSDNLATWSLEVPLATGINELLLAQDDGMGTVTPVQTLRIERTTQFVSPRFVVQDAAHNRLLVLDVSLDGIIAVDAQTGARSQLSPPSSATENLIRNPNGMMLDPARNRVLVFQRPIMTAGDNIEFLAVDLTTGHQTELEVTDLTDRYLNQSPSAMLLSGETAFVADVELVYLDAAFNRVPEGDDRVAFTVRSGLIYGLDLNTGGRTPISGYQLPDASNLLAQINALVYDPAQSLLYVLDKRDDGSSIIKVNTGTGVRTPLTIHNTTANPFSFINPKALGLDLSAGRLLLLNGSLLNAIDLTTGNASVVSSNSVPEDEEYKFGSADHMVYDANANAVYMIDDALDQLLQIHGSDGSRSRVSSNGADDPMGVLTSRNISGFSLGATPFQVFIADRPLNTLFSYNLQTGVKAVLSNPTIDKADDDTVYVVSPKNLAWDSDAGRLLLMNSVNALIAVDPQNGKASPLARFNSFLEITDMLHLPGTQSVYFSSPFAIFKAVLDETPESSVLSANGVPSTANNFSDLLSITPDIARNRLLGVDAHLNALSTVDLTTGERTPISSLAIPETNGGPTLQIPRALVVDGDQALVLDTGRKAIVAVNLTTGVRSIFYDYQNVAGNRLYNPTHMELHPQFGYLLLSDDVTDALMALDLETRQLVTVVR